MATTLADAYVRLRPDTSEFGKDIEKNLVPAAGEAGKHAGEKAGKETEKGFKSAVKGIAEGIAALGVFDFLKETINAGREAATALRLTEAVIKSTGGVAGVTSEDVRKMSEEFGALDGIQTDVIQSGANVGLTFTEIRNQAGEGNDIFTQYLGTALDVSAALKQDLQPSMIQLGKAINDPATGMATLRRIGVSFTQAQIDQAKAMQKSGDLMGAQKLILGELSKEFGGAAAAATDPAQKASVAWKTFQEELGLRLLPVVNQVLTAFLPYLPAVTEIITTVADFVTHNKLLVVVLLAVAAAVWLVNLALWANPVGLVVIAIGLLVAGFVYLWQHVSGFKEFFINVWRGIRLEVKFVVDLFTKDIPAAWSYLYEHTVRIFQSVRNAIAGAWSYVYENTVRFGQSVHNAIVAAWDAVVSKVEAVVGFFRALPGRIGAFLLQLAVSIYLKGAEIVAFFQALPGRILAFLLSLPEKLVALGRDMMHRILFEIGFGIGLIIKEWLAFPGQVWAIMTALWTGLTTRVHDGWFDVIRFFQWAPGAARAEVEKLWLMVTTKFDEGVTATVAFVSALWTSVMGWFQRGVASAVAFAEALPGRIGAIFTSARDTAVRLVTELIVAVMGWFNSLPGRVGAAFTSARDTAVRLVMDLVNGVIGWFAQMGPRATGEVSSLAASVRNALAAAGTWLYDAGRNILLGLVNGVKAGIGNAIGAVKDAMGTILAGAKAALGIKSASTFFADQVGKWIPAGIAVGVTQHAGLARASVTALSGSLSLPAPAAPWAGAGAAAMDRVVAMLEKVRDAVDRVAPGVGTEINGSVGVMRQLGRAM